MARTARSLNREATAIALQALSALQSAGGDAAAAAATLSAQQARAGQRLADADAAVVAAEQQREAARVHVARSTEALALVEQLQRRSAGTAELVATQLQRAIADLLLADPEPVLMFDLAGASVTAVGEVASVTIRHTSGDTREFHGKIGDRLRPLGGQIVEMRSADDEESGVLVLEVPGQSRRIAEFADEIVATFRSVGAHLHERSWL